MNSIRRIQDLNKLEIENGISPSASWHTDHRDSAYIYIGGLPFELTEGDIITIFSQYGEPTYINLIRDKETGKSRGFCFLKYEDQRSTDLAVDNLGGCVVKGRTLNVDHTVYKKRDDEPDEGTDLTALDRKEGDGDGEGSEEEEVEERRPMLKEEIELAKLMEDQDDEDPMKAFLIQEKKEEVALALARVKGEKKGEREHRHRHRHRSRRVKEEEEDAGERRSRHGKEKRESRRAGWITPDGKRAAPGRSRSPTPVRNGAARRWSRSITPVTNTRRRSSREDDRRKDDWSVRRSPRRDSRERGDRRRDDDARRDRDSRRRDRS